MITVCDNKGVLVLTPARRHEDSGVTLPRYLMAIVTYMANGLITFCTVQNKQEDHQQDKTFGEI